MAMKENPIWAVFLVFLISIIIAVPLIGLIECNAYKPIKSDYMRCITVDKSEKVQQALAIATEDVLSRKFIVVGTTVKYRFKDGSFKVEVSGVSEGSLLSMGE